MESITCKNCSNIYEKNYCNNCGQRAIENRRISTKEALVDFAQNTLLFDKKLLYTLKSLILQPGKVGHAYINGQRKKYTKPSRYLIFIVALYAVLIYFFQTSEVIEDFSKINFEYFTNQLNHSFSVWSYRFDVNYLFSSNVVQILILTAFLPLIFRKYNFTYLELLMVNSYYFSTTTLITFTFLTFYKMIFGISMNLGIVILIFSIYIFWAYNRFYHKENTGTFLLKILLITFITSLVRVLITLIFCFIHPIPMNILK
jgi:hypothetical protein